MRAKLIYVAIFAVFFVPAIVIQWPASWLQVRIGQANGSQWLVSGAEGTIWNGRAALMMADSGASSGNKISNIRWRVVQNIRWKLRWNELWQGRLAFETTLEQGSVLILIRTAGIAVEELDTQLPASVLSGVFSGPIGRYGWMGVLQAKSPAFKCAWHSPACEGEIDLLWKDAGVSEIQGPALGSYRSRIVGEGQSVHFDLTTIEGRLQITGTGDVGAGGLRFNGEASATGIDAGRLEAQLRTLGRPVGSAGKYALEYRESTPAR